MWLDALQIVLERLGLKVVGRAVRSPEARRLLDEHAPDVVVVDFSVLADDPANGGTSTILMRARAANPNVRCIVLSETDGPDDLERAFNAGATIFCASRTEPDDLAAAIRQSFEHSIYFAPAVRAAPDPVAGSVPPAPSDEAVILTRRETEILRLAAEGHSNAQLAKMLWVTEQTVKFHLSNIYRKLGVSNRTEASRWAQRNGLLSLTADQSAA
jgi:DNA-binding NarL/FixJ family response regulator